MKPHARVLRQDILIVIELQTKYLFMWLEFEAQAVI